MLLAASLLMIYSCSKDSSSNNNGGGNSTADSYHPLTANSFWTYKDSTDGSVRTLTATNKTQNIGGQTYTVLVDTSSSGIDTVLASNQGHDYYYYLNSSGASTNGVPISATLHYLNDTASVGSSWQYNAGTVGGLPATVKTTVVEKNVSVSVNSKTYNNVYHTRMDVSVNAFGTQASVGSYDFFIAKGVGIVRIRAVLGGGLLGSAVNTDTELTDYSIK